MKTDREKLIEVLDSNACDWDYTPDYADYLISNGVTIPVRCGECKHALFIKSCSKYECTKGCGKLKYSTDFCSYGERKEE